MTIKKWPLIFCVASLALSSVKIFAGELINGVWKHSAKPAWIEIIFGSEVGSASIKRHDNNSKAIGLNIIIDIKPVINQSSQWVGKMYSAVEDNYVEVKIILVNQTTLVVYDNNEGISSKEILRLFRD